MPYNVIWGNSWALMSSISFFYSTFHCSHIPVIIIIIWFKKICSINTNNKISLNSNNRTVVVTGFISIQSLFLLSAPLSIVTHWTINKKNIIKPSGLFFYAIFLLLFVVEVVHILLESLKNTNLFLYYTCFFSGVAVIPGNASFSGHFMLLTFNLIWH